MSPLLGELYRQLYSIAPTFIATAAYVCHTYISSVLVLRGIRPYIRGRSPDFVRSRTSEQERSHCTKLPDNNFNNYREKLTDAAGTKLLNNIPERCACINFYKLSLAPLILPIQLFIYFHRHFNFILYFNIIFYFYFFCNGNKSCRVILLKNNSRLLHQIKRKNYILSSLGNL